MINILMSRSYALSSNWAIEHTKKILKKEMKVVVLGFSFFHNLSKEDYFLAYGLESEYRNRINESFLTFGITNVEWIYYYDMSKEEMINLIKTSDILYLPGGAPDLMYDRIIEKGLLEELEAFNKIVIGSSAGAMIQLEQYHISPDYDYKHFSINKGLGYIDNILVEVHFRRKKVQKKSMRRARKMFLKPVYIIPDDGMVIINEGEITVLNEARQYFTKNKKVK